MLLMLQSVTLLQAQRIHGYVNGGYCGAQVEGDELKGFGHTGLTGGVGAFTELTENGRWALGIETDYTVRGVYHNSGAIGNLYNMKLSLHYVDIPLTLYFTDPFGGLQIGAGLVYGRLVAQPHGIIRFNPNVFVPDTTNMAFLKNDLSAALEIRFNIAKGLIFSTRYQFSLIKVKKDWMFYDISHGESWSNDCYNRSLQLRFIWQFGYDDSYQRKGRANNSYSPTKKHRR